VDDPVKKVLVVEDHPDMRKLLSIELELMGYQPVTAADGQEGAKKAVDEKPDLVLLDILMPGMDGRELARTLRGNPETKNIPILAATALSRYSDLKSCLEAGCNDWIVKPFTYKDLEEKLHAFI
jgi:two-component system, OmpR family, alkaline phosphatase synthesis response regulator PhoP